MNKSIEEKILNQKGVRPTTNRILIVRELLKADHPISIADFESLMDYSMDKASIFRVLELFTEKDVVHVIEDGSRSLKYELCHCHDLSPGWLNCNISPHFPPKHHPVNGAEL